MILKYVLGIVLCVVAIIITIKLHLFFEKKNPENTMGTKTDLCFFIPVFVIAFLAITLIILIAKLAGNINII